MTTRKQKIEKYGKNANPHSDYAIKVAKRRQRADAAGVVDAATPVLDQGSDSNVPVEDLVLAEVS